MADRDMSWAIPLMRAGYAGRGIVYIAIAGLSLWAIWSGGEAQGTSSAFAQLESSTWGVVVLVLIGLGLLAYAAWRLLDAAYDLEDYGTDMKGMIARAGQVTTGVIHGVIGIGAFIVAFANGGGEGSTIVRATAWVMDLPGGRLIVGIAGVLTICAGIYYTIKAVREKYREHLMGNHFTANWNWVLKAGVLAQAIVILIIGVFFVYAGVTADPNQAGGLGQTFSWLREQAYGQALVILICVGLLGFAVFCFVNARYRIVRAVADGDDIETLADRLTTA